VINNLGQSVRNGPPDHLEMTTNIESSNFAYIFLPFWLSETVVTKPLENLQNSFQTTVVVYTLDNII
jgi:hypothetical protein